MSLRRFRRLSRFAFVWLIIGAMTINTATAGHFMFGCGAAASCCDPCYDLGPCVEPCGSVCGTGWTSDMCYQSGCAVSGGYVGSSVSCGEVSDLCCGDFQVESCVPQGSACDVDGLSECCSGEYAVVSECGGSVVSTGCATPGCATPGCVGQGCAGTAQSTVVDEGSDGTPVPADAPADDANQVTGTFEAAEDESVAPAEAPEADSVDDLFDDFVPSEPATPEPPREMTDPLVDPAKSSAEPEPLDNLFDDPAADLPAATPESAEPADSLFDDPAPTAPEPELPSVPTEPEDTGDFGDLFGSDTPEPAEAAPVAAEEPVFEEPAALEEPAAVEEPGGGEMFEDLFGDPPADVPETPATPAEEPSADDTESDDFGDLFGQQLPSPQKARQMYAAGQVPMRTWTDNTGQFQIEASLVEIGSDYVRLMKGSDRFATVPLRRLSDADFAYVQGWASLLGRDTLRVAVR